MHALQKPAPEWNQFSPASRGVPPIKFCLPVLPWVPRNAFPKLYQVRRFQEGTHSKLALEILAVEDDVQNSR